MSITLNEEFVSAKEACISWSISYSLADNGGKATLFLSDINQSSPTPTINLFSITKYQIRANEFFEGSHSFTNLEPGIYVAKIIVVNSNSELFESSHREIKVFNLEAPLFSSTTAYIPGNKKFTIYLMPRGTLDNNELTRMSNGKVTFILFGQHISGGVNLETNAGAINMIFPYNRLTNTYTIDDLRLENNIEYELSCFYTNEFKCSSDLSVSKIIRPTNLPNKITELEPVYNSVTQTLTINHNMPNNVSEYVPINCRATIKDVSNPSNETIYISSQNSAGLTFTAPKVVPSPSDPIVFNLTNESLLPLDSVFTITLAIENSDGYGEESEPIYCVHPVNYVSKSVLNANLTFSLTSDNDLQIADATNIADRYIINTNYDVKFESDIFKYVKTGSTFTRDVSIYKDDRYTMPTGILDLNLATDTILSNYELGNLYQYVLNVYYEKTFVGDTRVPPLTVNQVVPSVTINPKELDKCFFYFIPHFNPNSVTLTAVPDNESITVSWSDLTAAELNGYKLHHYEYYIGDLPTDFASNSSITWTSVNKNVSHTFNKLTDNLINGTTYTFNVRAVTFSDNELYGYDDRLVSTPSTIVATPFGIPSVPIYDSKLPEDGKSTVEFTLANVNPLNGGDFDEFEASIDNVAEFTKIDPQPVYDANTGKYNKVFILSNDILHNIRIRVVTKNKSDASVKRFSDPLIIQTSPYAKPLLPTNFRAIPYTSSVDLSWTAPSINTILNIPIKYEVSYKLDSDPESSYTLVPGNPIAGTSYRVQNLVSNLLYNFKIRSQVVNVETSTDELDTIIYSVSDASISSKPFIYSNPPKMELVTGQVGSTIDVKLSPAMGNVDLALNNFYNNKFNYYATIYEKTDTLKARPKTTSSLNVENTDIQTLTLNTFNNGSDGSQLVDFSLYVIESYYEMFNSETNTFYPSANVNSQAFPLEPDDAPALNVEDTVVGVKSVTLFWTIPKLAGLNIVSYEISNRLEEENPWREIPSDQITQDADKFSSIVTEYSDSTNPTMTTIEPGFTYKFWIRAKIQVNDEFLYSAKSNMVVAYPYNNPGKPISLVASVLGDGKLKVDWAVGTLGFLPLRSYQIKIVSDLATGEYVPNNEAIVTLENCNLSNTNTFVGLTNGTTYTVSIRMVTINETEGNKLIFGEAETISEIVFDFAKAPANFVTYSHIDPIKTVRLSWDAVIGNDLGGLVFDHYEVMSPNYDNGAWQRVPDSTLYYNFDFTGLTIDMVNGIQQINFTNTDAAKWYKTGVDFMFYVKAVTKKPNNDAFSGNESSSRNMPIVSAPNKVIDASVDRTAGYNDISLPATNGILYMKIPNAIAPNSHSNFSGLWYEEDYVKSYEVQLVNGTVEGPWISPSWRGNSTGIKLTENTNSLVINNVGLHVWGGYCSEIENRTDPITRVAIFIPDDTILLGKEYKFRIRRIGYNLYNTIQDTGVWRTNNFPTAQLPTPIYSEISEFIVNTSYYVTPQEHHYDLPSVVYYANPLLEVTSTPSNGKIILSWDAANDSVLGGLTLNYYEVQLNEEGWTRVDDTTYEFSPLTNGTEYTVSVRTNCTHTETNISGIITTKVFTGIPVSKYNVPYLVASAPTNLVISYPGSQQVKIVWDAVTGDNLGGLSLKRYEVTRNRTVWTPVDPILNEYTFDELTNGTQYDISVKAITTYNDATPSSVVLYDFNNIQGNSASISAIPRAKPVAPTFENVTQEDGKLTIAWSYNTLSIGLLSFSSFKGVAGSYTTLIESIATQSLAYNNLGTTNINDIIINKYSFPFSGLTNGVKYNLKIVPVLTIASTEEFIEGYSLITRPFVPYVKASAPTNLITTPGDKQIKLQWNAVAGLDLGGLSLQRYEVSKDNGSSWVPVASDVHEYLFTMLDNGISYSMRVRAVTEFIDADPLVSFENIEGSSETVSAIPFVKPGTVSDITTSVINNLFTFTFIAPSSVNNNNMLTQFYEYSIDNESSWVPVDLNAPWPNVTVGNDSFSFQIRVYILNPNNSSIHINGDIVTVNNLQNVIITTIQNLKATVANGTVILSWNPVSNMNYQVIRYASPNNITTILTNPNVATYEFTGLTNGVQYNFGVAMYTSGKAGPVANISATPITTPTIGVVSLNGGILSISVDYGGVSQASIFLTAYRGVLDSTTENGITYTDLSLNNSLSIENIITSSPVTFSVNTTITMSTGQSRQISRNYFTILITNSIGATSTIYTTLDLSSVSK
jgi:hypothetical protein